MKELIELLYTNGAFNIHRHSETKKCYLEWDIPEQFDSVRCEEKEITKEQYNILLKIDQELYKKN